MKLAAALTVAIAAGTAVWACSHDAKPAVVEPDPHPPLPPSSGTPIGYLIDDATELALRDDQLTQLKAIDGELQTQLGSIDASSRGSAAPSQPQQGRRRGGRRGGMGGGGGGRRGGNMGNGNGSGSGTGSGG